MLAALVLAAAFVPSAAMPADAPPTVLITGASRGIGLELARQYAVRGWRVIATARKPQEAAELRALAAQHANVVLEPLDVTDHAGIDALAAKYRQQPIDVLINNAGVAGPVPQQTFGSMDYAVFRDVLEVNTIGPLKVAEAFLPNLLAGQQKKLVTLSTSEASFGRLDAARLYWYRSSKAAVNMLMLNLAHELKGRGVTVALVNPGPVATDMMRNVHMPLQKPADAVAKVIGIIDRMTPAETGRFWDYKGGEVPW